MSKIFDNLVGSIWASCKVDLHSDWWLLECCAVSSRSPWRWRQKASLKRQSISTRLHNARQSSSYSPHLA
jgi:hypothetical protein